MYKIKTICRDKGITQKELAKKVDVKDVMISLYVQGKKAPSVYRAKEIADALGVKVDDLL